jgi:predicted DNA-binding ribbon-helix-helix protein
MKSPVVKRSIVVAGHKTSVSLEEAFWTCMKEISSSRHMTLSDLVSEIDKARVQGNLSSAIRLFVLDHYRNPAPADHAAPAAASELHSASDAP